MYIKYYQNKYDLQKQIIIKHARGENRLTALNVQNTWKNEENKEKQITKIHVNSKLIKLTNRNYEIINKY